MSILTQDQRNMSNLHNQIQYFNNNPLIPSDLRITINTGVPGFQSIIYKPQMSIPDTKEKKIWFTPLVRLNQRIVDKVPPEYRIKQFFNKGLYESLLRYHGIVPIKKEDHQLEDAEKGAALAEKRVSLAEKKVEKAQRRVNAAENAVRKTTIGGAGEFENDGAKSDELAIGESSEDDEMMGGGLSEAYDSYIRAKKENDDYKKYLTPDEYKKYITNKNFRKKKLFVNDVREPDVMGADGKIIEGKVTKDGTYREAKNLRILMQKRKKDDEKNKLTEATSANNAKLAKLENDRLAKNVSDAKKAVDANNVLAKKNADKKASDEKAANKMKLELSAATESLRDAEDELQQKQNDKMASDNHLRRIKADKADPNKNKASAKADAIWALNEAKTRGNFNNNIKVTLDTLFKNGNVLYIDKKPYVIVDTQMIQGDWSLDVKPAEMATIYHTSQSAVYDKAEQVRRVELETAGLTSFTGENWIDRYPQFDKKYSRSSTKPDNAQNRNNTSRPLIEEGANTSGTIVPRTKDPNTSGSIVPRTQGSYFPDSFFDTTKPKPQLLTDDVKRRPTRGETLIDNYGKTQYQGRSISFRKYFGVTRDSEKVLNSITERGFVVANNRNFFEIIRPLYSRIVENDNRIVGELSSKIQNDFDLYSKQSRRDSKSTKTDGLTETHYIDVIESINVYDNIGAGDCFFDAIAQALNLHNLNPRTKKPLSSNMCSFGKEQKYDYEFFDQKCIRDVVIKKMLRTFDDIIKNYINVDDNTRLGYDNELLRILRESNIEGRGLTANLNLSLTNKSITKATSDMIEQIKPRMIAYMSKSNYWGTDVTIDYLNKGSLEYLGIKLRIVVIVENDVMTQYQIDPEINNADPDEKLIFLYNLDRRHYMLMTFKDNKGNDQSIFELEEVPFVFWVYIVIFITTMMDREMLNNATRLMDVNFTFDVIGAHDQLTKNKDGVYKNKVCGFFNKKNGFCEETGADIVNKARSQEMSAAEKKRQADTRKQIMGRFPRTSLRQKQKEEKEREEIETEERRKRTEERNKRDPISPVTKKGSLQKKSSVSPKNRKKGGSPYYQYGGLNEVEKHREYQTNNYMRYPNIPVAYPVETSVARVEDIDKSISSVFVTIDLELHKGKTISNSELASSKCNHQYNAIKHSFAALTGTPYIIAPVYGGTRRVRRSNGTHKKRQGVRNTSRKRRNITNKRR